MFANDVDGEVMDVTDREPAKRHERDQVLQALARLHARASGAHELPFGIVRDLTGDEQLPANSSGPRRAAPNERRGARVA
jgi:hypothetical protein